MAQLPAYHGMLVNRDVLDPLGEPVYNHDTQLSDLIRWFVLVVLAELVATISSASGKGA